MKKLKVLLPTAALFASPWVHKLIFLNLTAAWPTIDVGGAHFIAICGAGFALLITYTIVNDL